MDEYREVREELLRFYLWSWAHTANRQCDRALASDVPDPRDRLFDAILAVQAIRNARRAADALHKIYDNHWFPQGTLQHFDDEHGVVKKLRDILEHFDDYVVGSGRMQVRDAEPFRIRFDENTGRLSVHLTDDNRFEVNLTALREDLGLMVINLIVDLDALEDEPWLFDGSPLDDES